MRYYDVYVSVKEDHFNLILETNEPIETLELWARTMVNKFYPDFEIVDVDYTNESFFFFSNNHKLIHIMFQEREFYRV